MLHLQPSTNLGKSIKVSKNLGERYLILMQIFKMNSNFQFLFVS